MSTKQTELKAQKKKNGTDSKRLREREREKTHPHTFKRKNGMQTNIKKHPKENKEKKIEFMM